MEITLDQNEENNLEKLKRQVLQLDALNKISLELTRTTDLDGLLNKIIKYAAILVKAEAASILLLDKEKNELYFKVSLGKKSQEIKKYRVKVGEGIAGWVAEKGESLIVNDVTQDTRWQKSIDNATSFSTKSIICIPLVLEENIMGVMEVINQKDKEFFDKDDEEILNSFANQVVIALWNTNIVEDLNNYFIHITEILIQALENESLGPKGHFIRLARLATQVGYKLGISGKDYNNLYYSALLHDLGKIKLSRNIDIGFKEKENYHLIHSDISLHPIAGANMLKQINLFKDIVPIVKHHHENYDGTGFPDGLRGEEIPLSSRIIAVVEDYTKILYNAPIESYHEKEKAVNELLSLAGKKYDPKVINALKEIVRA
ncbi:MAG TPA: GAF domain-containing protein [Candidatus Atribacteria bacterium]|nr:GAF domain-containing protein [Candidatus Atribacteria bacterium]